MEGVYYAECLTVYLALCTIIIFQVNPVWVSQETRTEHRTAVRSKYHNIVHDTLQENDKCIIWKAGWDSQ